MNSAPSIGSVGLTVDVSNNRVKVLCPEVLRSEIQVETCLNDMVWESPDAKELLSSPTARFTARVIGNKGIPIPQFKLPGDIIVGEEARIHVGILDVVYMGGNAHGRLDRLGLVAERQLAMEATHWDPAMGTADHKGATFERLTYPMARTDVDQLIKMYHLCFTSYLVPLDEALVQGAAANSIFFVARNKDRRIIASAIGESLRVGPLTFLEISEEAAHPELRIRGAASECVRMVIVEGKKSLELPVVAFHEARMWRNVLGMGQKVGLTQFGGVLHQHCTIASSKELTSIPQTSYGSLAVFYAP
jgi:hypothetical protein